MSSLNLLRAYIRNNNIDGYLIPKMMNFFLKILIPIIYIKLQDLQALQVLL